MRNFYVSKVVVWMLRFFGSIFLWLGWFQFLIVDGWFLLGIVLIFLALCFSVFFSVSATSSYADDIAYIKICMSRNLWVVFTAERTGCLFPFPFLWCCWLLVSFDWNLLVNGVCYLRCKRDILIYRWCLDLFYLLLISGVRVFCKISAL